MDKVPFTFSGLEKIKLELDNLKKIDRPQVIQAISAAREHGDLKENAEYHAAKEKQAFIEGRITELEDVTSRAEVIDITRLSGETVTFGTKVNIVDEENNQKMIYQIVGPYEANLEDGLISVASPIARALIGKEKGMSVAVITPRGTRNYEILSIEVLLSIGKGKLTITGKLGEVMRESIQAATSYVKSKSLSLGINPKDFENYDIHIHVPEGATPKDGPSAGIAIFNSLVSSLTNNKIRRDVAMTGEITLRGRVLPIGGLKEKIYAASRAGIKKVLIPQENYREVTEFDKEVINGIKIIPVSEAFSILVHTLTKPVIPLNLSESQQKNNQNITSTH